MALDMYLLKYVFLGADSESMKVEGTVDLKVQGVDLKLKGSEVYDMNVLVGKWHAFHPLHAWFLHNGEPDEGETLFVSQLKLKNLKTSCQYILQVGDAGLFRMLCGDVTDEDYYGGRRGSDAEILAGLEKTLAFLKDIDIARQHFYEFSR